MKTPGRWLALLSGAAMTACSSGWGVPEPDPPLLDAAVATPLPDMVLGATLSLTVQHADSVSAEFYPLDVPAEIARPPAVPATTDTADVLLLGLQAGRTYVLRAVAWGAGGTVVGDSVLFTTSALPADLPSFSTSGSSPDAGYVVFSAGAYGVVIDNSGRVVWYHHFPDGPGLNFMAQPNGHYVARPVTPAPGDAEPWYEIDVRGTLVRTFGCADGLPSRFHDLIIAADASYWIMCDENRILDLSAENGVASAQVTGTVIQHVAADGTVLFRWSPFDHFAITDMELGGRSGPIVNWTHGNALALDADGNLLVSFRSLNEITRISTTTGEVLWRLGGLANQFAFMGTTAPPFLGQHGLRIMEDGSLLLLDNRGDPSESRVERYQVDPGVHAAIQAGSWSSPPSVVGMLGGSVQPLSGGHVLASYGNGAKVEEYDETGNVVWHLDTPGYVFRAQRITSLYKPGS